MSLQEPEEETSNMVTNVEIVKKLQEQEANNKWLREELKKLKDQMKTMENNKSKGGAYEVEKTLE